MRQRLTHLTKTPQDIIVIGGGIIGAGIAREARLRGVSVVLFEKGDFASGTSGRTSSLIHGGIRYLEQGEFRLVYEAIQERFTLSRLAPHLVTPLSFLFPIYEGGPRKKITVRIGMMLYDLFAGSKSFGRHQFLSKDEVMRLEPNLSPNGLLGAARFMDCQMDDARLCLATLLSAEALGAEIFNYAEVTGLIHNDGKVSGVHVKDWRTGDQYAILGAVIINATGSWTDTICKLEADNTVRGVGATASQGSDPCDCPSSHNKVRPTKGIHIVFPKITETHAIVLSSPDRGGIFFVMPWKGFSLIGTTDTDYQGSLDRVVPEKEEIKSLLEETAPFFIPSITKETALASFAGLRPLLNSNQENPWEMSRREQITWTPGGMLLVYGGKFTLFRKIAIRVINAVLSKNKHWRNVKKRPDPEPLLHGGAMNSRDERLAAAPYDHAVPPESLSHLMGAYGTNYKAVIDCGEGDADLLRPLTPLGYPLLAEVIYAARNEYALHLSDFMLRRTRLAHGPYRASIPLIDALAKKMGTALQWGPEETQKECEAYLSQLTLPTQ